MISRSTKLTESGGANGTAAASALARRILLVEDNRDANDMLCMLLAAEGHKVVTAFDGVTGLGLARAQAFDVLICDIGLPGMDGLELIGQLRAAPGVHIPFAIAISGYGQRADRERAIGAGFGHYFVKPVDLEALLALVASDAVTRFIAGSQRR
jgi:CheY-like chemotaxis protein